MAEAHASRLNCVRMPMHAGDWGGGGGGGGGHKRVLGKPELLGSPHEASKFRSISRYVSFDQVGKDQRCIHHISAV